MANENNNPAAETALAILVRHFYGEFFHTDLVTSREQVRFVVVGMLAAIGGLGILLPYVELDKYGRLQNAWVPPHPAIEIIRRMGEADKLFYLCCAMAVVAFAAAIEWDELFPDVRDYHVLTPMPIRMREIFAAKVAALLLFCSLFVAVATVPASIALPMVMGGIYLRPGLSPRWFLAQGTASALAGYFCFFSIVAVQGTLMLVLPPRAFRRIGVWVQMALLVALLCSLAVIIQIPNLDRFMDTRPEWALRVPPLWFLGLYDRILGSADPLIAQLAQRAWMATGAAAAAMLLLYATNYRRHARRVLETLDPQPKRARGRAFEWLLAHTIAREPGELGILTFMARTMARSRRHKLFLAAYVGAGFCLVLYGFVDLAVRHWLSVRGVRSIGPDLRYEILSIPLVLSFFVLSGLQFIFSLPVDLDANWIFRLTEPRDRVLLLNVAWKALAAAGILPVVLVTGPLEIAWLGAGQGVGAIVVTIVLSMVMVEVLMRDFTKIPFTCSYLPGKINPAVILPVYWGGFLIYASVMTAIEGTVLARPSPIGFLVFVSFLIGAYRFARSQRLETWGTDPVIYEDDVEPAVRTLGLMTSE